MTKVARADRDCGRNACGDRRRRVADARTGRADALGRPVPRPGGAARRRGGGRAGRRGRRPDPPRGRAAGAGRPGPGGGGSPGRRCGCWGPGRSTACWSTSVPQWLLVAEAGGREVLVPLARGAVAGRAARPGRSVPGEGGQVFARLGLGSALRGIARDRLPVQVVAHRRRACSAGTVDRVGADFVELTEHGAGERRRGRGHRRPDHPVRRPRPAPQRVLIRRQRRLSCWSAARPESSDVGPASSSARAEPVGDDELAGLVVHPGDVVLELGSPPPATGPRPPILIAGRSPDRTRA